MLGAPGVKPRAPRSVATSVTPPGAGRGVGRAPGGRLVYARLVTSRSSVVVFAVLAACSWACTRQNPDFCCTSLESCGAVGVTSLVPCNSAGSRPFCDDTGQFGPARTCIVDPSAPACSRDEDCTSPARPVCDTEDTGTCTGCQGSVDCARFGERDRCHPGTGACVACVDSTHCTEPTAPVCGDGGTCTACTADGQCASGLCDEASGACVDEAEIIHVDRGGGGTACTRATPCATFADGVAAITATRRWMRVGPGDYMEPTVTLDGRTVTIVAPSAGLRPSAFDQPVLQVLNASVVQIEGLRLFSAGGDGRADGLRCQAPASGRPRVTLIGVQIDSNAAFGIDASECDVRIERSRIIGNPGGGISIGAGSFHITNTFITDNGGNTPIGGVRLQDNDATSVFAFNTVADNFAANTVARALICTSTLPQRITSNILWGNAAPDQVSTTNCQLDHNLSNQSLSGSNNLMANPTFVSPSDFHLAPGSPGIDAADPEATLAVDFDGDTRPQGGGRDIGADEVAP